MSRRESALERIRWSRQFTQQFLLDLTPAEWFWSPAQYPTNIAWQVGHIAIAQYNLCLRRVRGRTAADEALISDPFIDAFKQGSRPACDQAECPPLEEIQRVFAAVHEQSLGELEKRSDAELDEPLENPHPRFATKLGAVEFQSQHELVHAGQIAMLRRLMGKPPLR